MKKLIPAVTALALGALAAMDGCVVILGENKDFRELDGGAGGGGGGGGAAMCRLLHDVADCGAGQRCTIEDETSGTTHCVAVAAAPLHPYDACTDDATCPQGTWCDHHSKVCKPFCAASGDCSSARCVAAVSTGGNVVPGARVCLAHCDPENLAPCGKGATCVYDESDGDLDCFKSGGLTLGAMCNLPSDCAGGYVCADSTCTAWCHPAGVGVTCVFAGNCVGLADADVTFNGEHYGYECP